MPAPFPPTGAQGAAVPAVPLPALYLYPLNDSFVPKHISLANNQRVKIGRQTNAKTVPAERNGYFDSKVLSRQHAEVWEDGGKIYIKDVKSSNGTFINGERLSPEGIESDPFELKSDDIVEFGIDIVGEDNKTIVHHKVAARVLCIFTDIDAQAAARVEHQNPPPSYGTVAGQAPGPGGPFNFAAAGQQPGAGMNGAPGQQRRPSAAQGLAGIGGMGGNVRVPGKSGLTFDHILSRLHGELQKSKDTGAELHSLTNSMTEIQDTLGGNLPPNLPPYPSTLPSVMPPQAQQHQAEANASQQNSAAESASALADLQAQLRETQMSLATHVDKIRSLEDVLAEHEAIKHEVSSMRQLMEERKQQEEMRRRRSRSPRHDSHDDHHYMSDDDDDDARSVATVVPHELERVEEEDEEQLAAEEEEEEEERRRRREELGRPRTPEPTGMGMVEDEEDGEHCRKARMPSRSPSPPLAPREQRSAAPTFTLPNDLTERLTTLSRQLESALELSRTLEAQHTTAQATISLLESKVAALESLVHETQSQVQVQTETTQQLAETVRSVELQTKAAAVDDERDRERESLTKLVNDWKKSVEGRWSNVQEEWSEERERLRRAREEWEARMRAVEDGFGTTVSKVESGLIAMAAYQAQRDLPNGNVKLNHANGGLVTPPSPRSLSSDSNRPRHRRKRSSSSRGRSRSRSASTGASAEAHVGSSTSSSSGDVVTGSFSSSASHARMRAPWITDDSSVSDMEPMPGDAIQTKGDTERDTQGMPFPITPESSVLNHPLHNSDDSSGTATESRAKEPSADMPQFYGLSAAVGVLVLSAAAAAVLWRVKPETSL